VTSEPARSGTKRSSKLIFKRRLFLARRLIAGPAPSAQLIADARMALGQEIYPADASTALQHDLAMLRDEFECEIIYRNDRGYVLESPGHLALLDLPNPELEALAFLDATFSDSRLPNAEQIAALVDRIVTLLPDERRRRLGRGRRPVRLEHPHTVTNAPQPVLDALQRVIGRQKVLFSYRSSFKSADEMAQHLVAPYALIYRDGHIYLDGYCLECNNSRSDRYVFYRIDRILSNSLMVLPDQIGPLPPQRQTIPLRYILAPIVASRHDIALWFPGSEVTFAPDGSATVVGHTTDLWQARQVLLRYREHCRVLEPPELIELICESIGRMTALYPSSMQHTSGE